VTSHDICLRVYALAPRDAIATVDRGKVEEEVGVIAI